MTDSNDVIRYIEYGRQYERDLDKTNDKDYGFIVGALGAYASIFLYFVVRSLLS